ncbi:MAG TPA: sulfur carrier protein ThiS [Candidatus Krumholzibacteria bacterium]|nr:sulfur carrier protein ThiS [Candidatus Krumholzibacteria bacterium]
MRIRLNGNETDIESGAAVTDLLHELGIAPDTAGVAVALNETIVPRAEWSSRRLAPGDAVEVVRAVQGG